MPHRIDIRRPHDDDWKQVGGAVVHLYGFRYRVIVTDQIGELLGTTGPVAVRVNGVEGEDVHWTTSPEETAPRGYVSCELTLRAEP